MTIGGRLKEWRSKNKVGQKDASAIFGVSYSTYQKYELDSSIPGGEAIEAFVKAGINANWLLTGQGPMLVADTVSQPSAPIGDLVEPMVVIDYQRLKLAIETIEEALSKHRSRLQPDQKAKAIGLMYQMYEEEDKKRAKAGQDRASTILNELVKSMT